MAALYVIRYQHPPYLGIVTSVLRIQALGRTSMLSTPAIPGHCNQATIVLRIQAHGRTVKLEVI